MEGIQLPPLQTTTLPSKKLKIERVGKGTAVSRGIKQYTNNTKHSDAALSNHCIQRTE